MVCLMLANTAAAQKKRYPMHELSVSLSAGTSNLLYRLDEGSRIGKLGGGLEVGYAYNIKRWLAVVTGFGISLYGSTLNMDRHSGQYDGLDNRGDEFTFNYSLDGYSEKQSVVLFTVPVMARYTTDIKGTLRYYVAGGMKIGVPISANVSITSGTLTTSGYYAYEHGTYTDMPDRGFVSGVAGEQSDGKIKLNVAPLLALETGVRFRIGYQKDLMTSVYLDYSLGDIRKSHDRHAVEYQASNPSQFVYNSILNTGQAGKVNIFAAGVKIGLNF